MRLLEALPFILVISGFTSMMVLAVIVPGHPRSLLLVRRLVCHGKSRMEIRSDGSGETVLTVVKRDRAGARVITARSVLIMFLLVFVLSAPIVSAVLVWIL